MFPAFWILILVLGAIGVMYRWYLGEAPLRACYTGCKGPQYRTDAEQGRCMDVCLEKIRTKDR